MPDATPDATTRADDTPLGRVVTLDGPFGRAVVHEHGAHLTSWTPTGHEDVLFTSRLARFDGKSAIRGGVPVIFPQFGPGPLPKHGFARTARWTLDAQGTDDATTRATWPHAFALTLTIVAGDALAMTLAVENTGDAPFTFMGALHTYLRVGDVTRVGVRGLEGRRLRDQLAGGAERTEGDTPMRIDGSVDRVYLDAPGPFMVVDDALGRTLRLTTDGFADAVLWNPWAEGARAFEDMGDEEWRAMLCLEAAVVATPVTLAPGARWEGAQRLEVVSPLVGAPHARRSS